MRKRKKAARDPSKPKRPGSAFFVFMEGFRKQYREKHPNNLFVSDAAKAGAQEWKSMRQWDRVPFFLVAKQRMEEYQCQMRAYNKKLAGEEDEGSNKCEHEMNDEENGKQSCEVSAGEEDEGSNKSEYEMNDEESEKQSCEDSEEEEEDDDATFAVEMQTEKEKQDRIQDRATFVAVANQRKEGCEQQIKAHNNKLAGEEDEESDMSESEEEEEENYEAEVDSAIIGDLLGKRDEEVDVVRNLLAQQKRKEPRSSSSSLRPKKKTSSTKTIYDWMQRMNTDFRDYLTMQRKMLAEKELMLAKKKIKPQEILAELKTSDLDDMQTIKILDLMMRDHILFETFVGLPPEWKYKWLKVQLDK